MPVRPLRIAAMLAIALAVCLPTTPAPSVTSSAEAAAPPATPAKPVHRPTVSHGTLANRHVRTAPAKSTAPKAPSTVRRSAPAPHKTSVHRSRSRRVAHAHRAHHRAHRHGSVGGHVRNAAGEPVANATVSLGAGRAKHHRARRTVTDQGGHYVMRNVPAGRHRVTASKSGVGKASRALQIRAGAFRSGMDLKLAGARKHKKHRHKK
jgi:hypothetical protein